MSWLTFLPLEEFGEAVRFFFLLHDFQQRSLSLCSSVALSLPLTLCLLWLLANRFHMLLQLTSVLNYFTCDLRYFLRKSVSYLLKTIKINPSCCHSTFLSLVYLALLQLYCVPHSAVLSSEADLILLLLHTLFK